MLRIICTETRWIKILLMLTLPFSTSSQQDIGPEKGKCILPTNFENGVYTTNIPDGIPGEGYKYVGFKITCDDGYKILGGYQPVCYNGYWNGARPKCIPIKPNNNGPNVNSNGSAKKGNCTLPPYPTHGYYTTNVTNSKPGDRYAAVSFVTRCDNGYEVPGGLQAFCYNGYWNGAKPDCVLSSKTTENKQSNEKPTTQTVSTTTKAPILPLNRLQKSDNCILPQYPAHGTYTANVGNTNPGEGHEIVALNFTCDEGFGTNGPITVFCYKGQWSTQIPQCVPMCRLPPHPSVEYQCLVSLDFMDGFRSCNEYEPSNTLVRPSCRPLYYSTNSLKFMHCVNGEWSSIQKCTPDCGTLIPNGSQLVLGGEEANLGEVPWHAAIYKNTSDEIKQICGGSIISNKIVISAAHCFWSNLLGKLPESDFLVVVGKLYRAWDSKQDNPQWSEVKSVHLPVGFRGSASNYQADVAVVVLASTIQYNSYIRPVCLDFDVNFERRQLQPGNTGKVAGWGLTAENGGPADVLRVVDLPYVSTQTCIDQSPASFGPFITIDKICAGFANAGIALCKGDSGGGLAFLELDKGTPRYYLRGVASAAPTNANLCNANTFTSFTRLISHEYFITRFWRD